MTNVYFLFLLFVFCLISYITLQLCGSFMASFIYFKILVKETNIRLYIYMNVLQDICAFDMILTSPVRVASST